jgi:hypothetical protein
MRKVCHPEDPERSEEDEGPCVSLPSALEERERSGAQRANVLNTRKVCHPEDLSGAKGTKDLVFLFRQLSKKENAPERSAQMFE